MPSACRSVRDQRLAGVGQQHELGAGRPARKVSRALVRKSRKPCPHEWCKGLQAHCGREAKPRKLALTANRFGLAELRTTPWCAWSQDKTSLKANSSTDLSTGLAAGTLCSQVDAGYWPSTGIRRQRGTVGWLRHPKAYLGHKDGRQ